MENVSQVSTSSVLPTALKGLSLFVATAGIAGVAEGLKQCVAGAAEACEIKPEMGMSLASISMIGVSLVFMLLSCFTIVTTDIVRKDQGVLCASSGFIICFATYFSCKALGSVARHGLPAYSKQKKFISALYFGLLLAELISVFGLLVAIILILQAKK